MLRAITLFLTLIFSVQSYAATASAQPASDAATKSQPTKSVISLLDNRFRVDPTISQITFVIYRSKKSQPVVLVRPDGVKYYAWRAPEHVKWYQEKTMDIVSIDHPMPGPWQAIGKVTPKNNIKLISNLALTADKLPLRIYQGETFKFSARLTSDGKSLTIRDFLERINLNVTLSKFLENEDQLAKEALPPAIELGTFSDDGRGLDEFPGDGVFTVKLNISAEPGKYRMRITSGNGVFLRAQEQLVLVYPAPYTITFIQSRLENNPHHIKITAEPSVIEPGSLAAHIEHENEYGERYMTEGRSGTEGTSIDLSVPYHGAIGNYKWHGRLYATDLASHRQLHFDIPEHTYTVVDDIDYEKTRKMQEEAAAAEKKRAEEKALLEYREAQRLKMTIYIVIGNVLAVIVGLFVWLVIRKTKARRELRNQMQLNMPKE